MLVKGKYLYKSAKTGRFVAKSFTGQKRRIYVSPSKLTKRDIRTGRFLPKKVTKKQPSKSVSKLSTGRAEFLGLHLVGVNKFKRWVYNIPFRYGPDGLEIDPFAVRDAIQREKRLHAHTSVTAWVEVSYTDEEENDEGELEEISEEVWYPASKTYLVDEPNLDSILFREISQAILGSRRAHLQVLHLQFARPETTKHFSKGKRRDKTSKTHKKR